MRELSKLFLLGALVLVSLIAGPPAKALDPSLSLAQLNHRRWTMTDGAPYGVRALAQTPDGFLWVGGDTGLFRFDGIRFERMPGLYHHKAMDEAVSALLASREGHLWIGYQSGRIAVLRRGRLVDVSPASSERWVWQLVQDRSGAVWASTGTTPRPLYRYTGKRWQTIGPDWGFPWSTTGALMLARNGSLWASPTGGPLMVLAPGSNRFQSLTPQRQDIGIGQAPDGTIWASDSTTGTRVVAAAGKIAAANQDARIPSAKPGRQRRRIFFDRDGNLWGATTSGVFRIARPETVTSGGNPREDWFAETDGLSSDQAQAMIEDREGNIWIATSNGIDRFSTPAMTRVFDIPGKSRLGYIVVSGRDGSIYAADSEAIYRVPAGGTARRLASGIDNPQTLCEDARGGLWVGANDALRIISPDRPPTIIPNSTKGAYLDCVVGSDGSIWFSRLGELQRRFGDTWAASPYAGSAIATVMLAEPDGSILVHLRRDGLHRVTSQGTRLIWKSADIPGRDINVLHRIGTRVLIGTASGLAMLEKGRITVLARDYGWLSGIAGITDSADGTIWLLTRAGVVRLSAGELEKAFSNPDHGLTPRIFGFADGMPGPAAVGYSRNGAVRGGDGRLWFVTTRGLVTIHPAQIPHNQLPPPVRIVALTHNGARVRDPGPVQLPAGTSGVQLDYTALSLTAPERVRFRYRLVGADTDWVEAGGRRQAFYTNLAPGTYRFQVIASNNDGVWNEEGASLDLTIPPTFLQSIWFKLLLGLLAVLLLALIFFLRLKQVSRRMRGRFEVQLVERERIARELHDTLLQGIQALLLHVKIAANALPDGAAPRRPLEQALAHAQGVLVEGRDRVRDLRGTGSATDFSTALEALAANRTAGTGMATRLIIEGEPRNLDPMVREELQRIAEEAIRNAVHHSGAAAIDIVLAWHRRRLSMSVRDDGCGIADAVLERGERPGHFGLTGMRERATRIGGRLTIAGASGKGTAVSIVVPARTAYRAGPTERRGFWKRILDWWRQRIS